MTTPTETTTDTTQTTTEAPRALADGDTIEVDFGNLGLDAPDAEPPKAEPKPEPEPATEVQARPEGRKGNLTKALKEERGENKQLRADRDRYKRLAEEARGGPVMAPPGVKLAWPTPGLSEQERNQIVAEARQATDFGQPTEKILGAVERLVAEREKRMQEHLSQQIEHTLRVREVARMERDFVRDGHTDYRDVTQRSGIFDMLAFDPATGKPGPRFNRRIAEEIAGADDQVAATYWIAKELLGEADDARPARRTPDPEPDPERSPSRRAEPTRSEPAKPEDLAEAERRGARDVVARVAENGAKPRGVRTFTPAGAPQQVRLDEDYRKYLDGQWDKNPQAVMALFDKQPDLRDWYEGRRRG